jgi:O-6-methylguanine DNA methyltransferase
MSVKVFVGQMAWEPVGKVFVAATDAGIVETRFGGAELSRFIADARERLGMIVTDTREFAAEGALIVDDALRQLDEYFQSQRRSFDLPIDYRAMTDFQRSVYECVIQIPAGQMDTYQGVANKLNNPKAIRAVGGALARNPIPILIPCHRVVGSDGTMIGYSGFGGVEVKRLLLKLEGSLMF